MNSGRGLWAPLLMWTCVVAGCGEPAGTLAISLSRSDALTSVPSSLTLQIYNDGVTCGELTGGYALSLDDACADSSAGSSTERCFVGHSTFPYQAGASSGALEVPVGQISVVAYSNDFDAFNSGSIGCTTVTIEAGRTASARIILTDVSF